MRYIRPIMLNDTAVTYFSKFTEGEVNTVK